MSDVPVVLKKLFSSKLRIKILSHFFTHSVGTFYVRELAGTLDEPAGTLARELGNLEMSGILISRAVGNQKHYALNKSSPIIDDLRNIFIKTTGYGEAIKKALSGEPGVEIAFIYGSSASGEVTLESDIDLMLVGTVADRTLASVIGEIESRLNREINYTVYSRDEVKQRLGHEGDFVHEVFTGPRILLVGSNNDEFFSPH